MTPTILAIRAVTGEYALQILRPILWIGLGVYAIIMGLIIWIAADVSSWWLLLAIVPSLIFVVGLLIWVIVWTLARRLSPQMNKTQKKATKKFVSHIGKTAEHMGTPRVLLIVRVIKDVLFPPVNGNRTFIAELAQTPGDMHRDFEQLRKLF